MVQVKSSVFERVNSIYNSILLTLISESITSQFVRWKWLEIRKFKGVYKFWTLSFHSILLDRKHHHQRLFSFLHYRHHIGVDKCLWYRFEGHNESRQRWIGRIWKLELGNDRMSGHHWQKWTNLKWINFEKSFLLLFHGRRVHLRSSRDNYETFVWPYSVDHVVSSRG